MQSILIVDDHPFILHSYKTIILSIEKLKNYTIYEANNFNDSINYIKLKPSIAIIDLNLGEESGISIIKHINEKSPATRVIVISFYENIELIWLLIKLNVKAFIPKSADINTLKEVLENLEHIKDYYLPDKILAKYHKFNHEIFNYLLNNIKLLTNQEKMILKLKIKNFKNKEIARILNIKPKTIENHINNIKNKIIPPNHEFKEFFDNHKDTLNLIIPLLT